MENQETDFMNKKVGNTEQPRSTVSPAKVTIVNVIKKDKKADGTAMTTPMVQFQVKHPDKEDFLLISKIKYLDGEKVATKGFWVQLDENGNFYKGSTIDILLKYLDCASLGDCCGKEIDTKEESENSPYLCLKAY